MFIKVGPKFDFLRLEISHITVKSPLLNALFKCLFYADYSNRGSICTAKTDNSTWTKAVQINLNNVFNALELNVNLHNGFYTAMAGERSDRIYGLIQCRGDVSTSNFANCTRESFKVTSK
ncbi:unnamed protein product [Fraxinus pennsylvanica]|uniref:Gnk2-homologous domain-containing protein n=1 Tax=Fraxinus pennsylvanica TaxID=56036 RepID=A0AAD1YT76_9LAMI|nr:unnamed protein product [Fraxinus pennsylvanica]